MFKILKSLLPENPIFLNTSYDSQNEEKKQTAHPQGKNIKKNKPYVRNVSQDIKNKLEKNAKASNYPDKFPKTPSK